MSVAVPFVLLFTPWCLAQIAKREKRDRFLPYNEPQVLQPERLDINSDVHHQEPNTTLPSLSKGFSLEATEVLKDAGTLLDMSQQRLRKAENRSSAALVSLRVGDLLVNRFSLVEKLSFESQSSVADGWDSRSLTGEYQGHDSAISLAESNAEDLPKGIYERYKIPHDNLLGSGSFGEAWLATDKTSGNKVVVKLFKETGEYIGGSDKVAFDERGSTGKASESEDGETHVLMTKKLNNHIGDMKHECDMARDVENRAHLVDPKWSRYQERLMKCVDINLITAGQPVFVALTFGGKKNLIRHIEERLDDWRKENQLATIVEYQQHRGQSCRRHKAIESASLEDALEECNGEERCIGIVAEDKPANSFAEGGNKPFLMCFGKSAGGLSTPSSFTQADSTSSIYKQHRGTRAISLRKKVLVSDLFGQFIEGLSLLEELGLSHHDIKISNAVVDHKGLVHLIDYGAMSYWGDQCSTVHTWNLAPPEFMQGSYEEKKACDRHYDVWSVANILLEMIQKSGHAKGKSKAARDPFLSLFCDAHHLECTSEEVSGKAGVKPPSKTQKEGWKAARHIAYNEMESARQQGLLTDPRVAKTIDEVFLQDPQFRSFTENFFNAALDPTKEHRPSFQDILTEKKWFAPLRRKPGSGGAPMKVVLSEPYSEEGT